MLMLYGWSRPFSRDELRALYPSRAAYVDTYRRGVDDLVAAGGLRAADVADAVRRGGEDRGRPRSLTTTE